MKKFTKIMSLIACSLVAAIAFILVADVNVSEALAFGASDDGMIHQGIYAGDIDLSGMTKDQAIKEVNKYVNSLKNVSLELKAVDDGIVNVTAGELGLTWENDGIIEEAAGLGREGNVVQRYKELKDLEHQNKRYDIIISFDEGKIKNVVNEKCSEFNQEAKDATLSREDGEFKVIPGQDGLVVDAEASAELVKNYLENEWNREPSTVELAVSVDRPKGKTEELEEVKDVLGTFTTSFSTSAKGRSANVRNGCSLINGTLLYPGDQFSAYDTIKPFTEENGYYLAGSYLNGLVVESLGGGICQVSSTLYNAVIRAELQVDERNNHSMVVTYVDLSADAAIAESSGKDFKFTNSTDYPIYIEGFTTDDKHITFTIYGKETRPKNRTISFESEKLEENVPEGEKCVADASQPVGYISVQSAHTGYRAQYWKIVKVDGEETERVQLNSSTYASVPKTAAVGTAGDVTGAMAEAIATQSIDFCKATAAGLSAAAQAANLEAIAAAQEAAAEAAAGGD